MGSYSGGGYSSYIPPKPKESKLDSLVGKFFKLKDIKERRRTIEDAFAEAEKQETSLIDAINELSEKGNVTTLEKPNTGIEIEYKLGACEKFPPNIATEFSKSSINSPRFFKCSKVEGFKYYVTYFGTETQETFAVKVSSHGSRLKLKGPPAPPYNYGIVGEEYVLRRAEQLGATIAVEDDSILQIARSIVQVIGNSHITERGTMQKEAYTQFALERDTGRIYSMILGICHSENRPVLVQLEIEYAGQFTNFPVPSSINEQEYVTDILEIANTLKIKPKFEPTTLTKYDWLMGRAESTREANKLIEEKAKAVIEGQEFFGLPLGQ